MQDINEMLDYLEAEEGTNVKAFLFRLLSKWYWFAFFGLLGLLGGYLMSKYSEPIYQMSSTILVKEESASMGLDQLFEGFDLGDKTNIENHILMLKSYTLNRQALENLNSKISWCRKGVFTDAGLYRKYPYFVVEQGTVCNLTGLAFYITPIDKETYQLKAEGSIAEKDFEFTERGRFGVPFSNEYCSFTIQMNPDYVLDEDAEYYFVFNDLNKLTKSYLERLDVALATKKADGINLSLKGSNPAREVDYLNELIRVYMNYGLADKNRTSENTVRFIDVQLGQIVDSLSLAGQNFTDFRSKNGIVDLSQEAGLVVEQLEEIETEKALAERRLEYFRNLKSYMGNAEQMKRMVSPSVVGIADAGLNTLIVKLGELYARKTTLSFVVKEKSPNLLMLNKEIRDTRISLDENLKNLLNNAEIELTSLNKRINKIHRELESLPQTEQELINIKRRFDLNNELYTFLLQKRAEAAITKASNVSDAQVLDPARIETAERIGPKTSLNLIIGLVLGLALPFLFIVIEDYFNDSIKSKEELEKASKLPILGEIAHNNYKKEMPILEHPRSGIAESFRGLRTNLQYVIKQKEGGKVISINSMIAGEGKTFTSLNLANIIAMDSKKVLLICCDLRRPRLGGILNLEKKAGLSTYLIGNHSLGEVVQNTNVENLFFIDSGVIPPNPAELLGSNTFDQLIARVRKEYDYVIMDNSPATLVTDGLLTGRHADSNIFVLRQGYSNKSQMKFINQLSENKQIPQLGMILNDVEYNAYGYGNNYGSYAYGYGYYDEDHFKRNWKHSLISKFFKR